MQRPKKLLEHTTCTVNIIFELTSLTSKQKEGLCYLSFLYNVLANGIIKTKYTAGSKSTAKIQQCLEVVYSSIQNRLARSVEQKGIQDKQPFFWAFDVLMPKICQP